ncbi:uncharacterized protein [Asterias amurensis]|uniref:uncharacterized protein n=1 Tax=Asterias amurensis TaxID=7602 RepID=UPI003AB74550
MMSNTEAESDVRKRFSDIHQRLKKLGVTDKQIAVLPSCQKLHRMIETQSKSKVVTVVCTIVTTVLLTALLLGVFIILGTASLLPDSPRVTRLHRDLSSVWMGSIMNLNIDTEACLVEAPEAVLDLFRSPVNCTICRDVVEIKKVTGLTPEEFESIYAYSARPVVVMDGAKNWTAQEHLSFQFFQDVYGPNSPVLEGTSPDCQFFPYRSSFDSLQEVFEMTPEQANLSDGSKPWYIGWSNCDSAAANVLRQHYRRPYFLPPESESSKTDWIFMGSPGYGAHMHIDNVELPSWQAQIKGHKRWTLEPPPECYLECGNILEVEVHPGEIIVLDTNKWFHQTQIIGSEMSITIGSEYD